MAAFSPCFLERFIKISSAYVAGISLSLKNKVLKFLPINIGSLSRSFFPEYVNEAGNFVDINASVTSVTDQGDGTFIYINEEGIGVTFDTDEIITTLSNDGDGFYTYTSEDGTQTTFNTGGETITVLVDNGDGTYTFEPAPDYNGDDVPITYTISDGTTTIPGDAVIDVLPVNDPPTSADNETVIDEDTSYTFNIDDFVFNDIDGDSLDHITIVDLPGNGTLFFDGNPVSPGDTIPATDIGLLIFTPVPDENGDDYAIFNFTVNDGTDDSEEYAFSIDVSPVNDAPTSEDESAVIDEDTSYTFSTDDFLFEDIDGDSLDHITISDLPLNGTLTLGGNPVNPGDQILPADIGQLVFTPDADENGNDYATFNFTVNDGELDSGQYTFSIDVTAVNDAPISEDKEVVTDEDTDYVFSATDFAFDDIDTADMDHITIIDLPINGTLNFNGNPVTPGMEIDTADIGLLVFTPNPDENGDDYATFNFTVNDGELDSEQQTVTVDVNPVNDPPTSADKNVSIDEDNSYSFSGSDFAFADIDGDSFDHITITQLPNDGVLTLNGNPVSQGDDIAPADFNNLLYTPDENASGENYGDFKFTVNDGTVDSAEYDFSIDVTAVADTPDLCMLGPLDGNHGLYDISDGGIVTISASYFSVNAGFENSHGYYVADSDGNPIGGAIIQDNAKELITQDIAFNTADYPGGVTLGFFIIPDGNVQNVDLSDGDAVTFQDIGGVWTPFVGGSALAGQGNSAYFSNEDLNADNYDHFADTVTPGNQNWEDLPWGGDRNHTDVNVQIEVSLEQCEDHEVQGLEGTLIGLPDIAAGLNDTDGSETLMVTISNIPEGVTLSDDQGNEFTATDTDNKVDVASWNLDELKALSPIGQDDFVLSVTAKATESSNGDEATSNLNILVDILHGPTTGVVDLGATPEDTNITFTATDLLSTSDDVDGDSLSVSNVFIDPLYGVIIDNGDDTYTFDPAEDYNGDDLPISYDITDGLSTISGSAIIDVTPVNDAPTSADKEVGTDEDTDYVFSATDFAFSDVDTASMDHVTIVDLPANGTLNFNGSPVAAGTDIPAADIGKLTFTPDPDENGDDYATFNFTVNDGELDSEPQTVTVDVAPVNDAPTSADNEKVIEEDHTYSFSGTDFVYNDIDGDSLDHVTITKLPNDGVLTLNGNPVSEGADIAASDLNDLLFTPDEDASGDNYGDFKFTVNDGNVDSVEYDFKIDVKADADVPSAGAREEIHGAHGLYDISVGGEITIDVSYFSVNAGYENSHGYYIANSDGDPIGGVILQDNVKQLGQRTVTFNSNDYPDGVTVGFFIIADGDTQNTSLEDGDVLSFENIGGVWTPHLDGNPLRGAQNAPAYFSDQSLNFDGYDHLADSGAQGNQNWEDLIDGGDLDHSDVNTNVRVFITKYADVTVQGDDGTLIELPNLSASLTDTDGSESLTVTISSIPDGATLSDSHGNTFLASAGNNSVDITSWDMTGLTIFPPVGSPDFNLQMSTTATETEGGDEETVIREISVDIVNVEAIHNQDPAVPAGYDETYGNGSANNINGDNHGNYIDGQGGNDIISGQGGSDILVGGSGKDQLSGDSGHDKIYGGTGNDKLMGNDGDDTLYGGSGKDTMEGNAGDDTLVGDAGNDILKGGDGNDNLRGGTGKDLLEGGTGNDLIYGGAGNDNIYGNNGNDAFLFATGEGSDFVDGGAGGSWIDSIELSGFSGLNHEIGWTLVLDSGTIQSTNDAIGEMILSQDSDGTITFDQGGSITFENVEKIVW